MARLFISYKSEDQSYAFAVRHWLMSSQGWADEDVFVDKGHLSAGKEWETTLLEEAEAAEAMLFLASEASVDVRSFCYRELRASKGQILTVTLKGLPSNDPRLFQALPERAKSRQIEQLDQQPTEGFDYVSPKDNTRNTIALNRRQVESIGLTLRDLGIAPDSFTWTPKDEGPFPGLRPLQEGDEEIFCGRALDIRDGLKALDDVRASITQRALIIQAPSGAGKSSFLRAGLWLRLRRSAAFTPLAIVRTTKGTVRNPTWGLIAGLYDTLTRVKQIRERLPLSRAELTTRVRADLPCLLQSFAEADMRQGQPRTLLLGIDQAEEMIALSHEDAAELDWLLKQILVSSTPTDLRLVLTARDDSLDQIRERLVQVGLPHEAIVSWRLHRLPKTRLDDVISGPAAAASQAGWPLSLSPELIDALAQAAGESGGVGGDALPILAVALRRLTQDHRAPDGQVTLPPSEAKAFLDSAMASAVADGLTAASATVDDLRRLVIPKLATWDPHAGGEGAAKRRVARADELFAGERVLLKPLADALVAQRLLTSSQTEGGTIYEIAHEALLRVSPLDSLIFERREHFEQARMLVVEAQDWSKRSASTTTLSDDEWRSATSSILDRLDPLDGGKDSHTRSDPDEYLLRQGERLLQALHLAMGEDFAGDLNSARPYLFNCIQRELKRIDEHNERTRARVTQEVEKRFGDTVRRLSGRAFVKPALQALQSGHCESALRLAAAGALLANDTNFDLIPELWAPLVKAIVNNHTAAILKAHEGPVVVSVFSSDGQFVLTTSSDQTARIWNVQTGTVVAVLSGHSDKVRGAAFSPDGSRVVTSSDDWTARVWDTQNGQQLAVLKAHTGRVHSASYSADGKRIATASKDRNARIWNAETGAELAVLRGHSDSVWAATFSPNGNRVATASSDQTARIWDSHDGIEKTVLKNHSGRVHAVSYSPCGKRLLTASEDRTARIWDADTGLQTALLNAHSGRVHTAAYSPNGLTVVTGSSDHTARIWDAETGEERATLRGHSSRVHVASFSADGQRVVTASEDRTARIWDAKSGTEIAVLSAHTSWVRFASFSPDGKLVATASSDHTARLWNCEITPGICALQGHTRGVNAASFSPDGKRVVTASEDCTARIWNAATGKTIAHLNSHRGPIWGATFSPDGQRLVTSSKDRTARVWDAVSGVEIAALSTHTGPVWASSFSADGKLVVTASEDQTARIWNAVTGAELCVLKAHTDIVRAASFDADTKFVVTASSDQTARVWDISTASVSVVLKGHSDRILAASISPDGKRIITASDDRTAGVWDRETGRRLASLAGHSGRVLVATLSPDGKIAATASEDRSVRIWDIATGAELATMTAHTGRVYAASFSADGKRLVTASEDRTIRIWDVARAAELSTIVAHSGRIHMASFCPDGRRVVTASADRSAKILDVSRSAAIARDRPLVLTAALSHGLGYRTTPEATDLLMQDAPEDLFAEALNQIGRRANDPEVQSIAAAIFRPL